MTESATERRYLSPRDCSELYGGTAAFWRKLVHTGKLPGFRIGEVLIVMRRADVEAFIESTPVDRPAECRDGRRRGKKPGRPRKRTQNTFDDEVRGSGE